MPASMNGPGTFEQPEGERPRFVPDEPKTIALRYTRGDAMTQPGGFIIRERAEEPRFIVHAFSRKPGSREPSSFFHGGYFDREEDAHADYAARIERARRYTAGGSLIWTDIDGELARERTGRRVTVDQAFTGRIL